MIDSPEQMTSEEKQTVTLAVYTQKSLCRTARAKSSHLPFLLSSMNR